MLHCIPMCKNRVFASMVLTASLSETEFIVVQFPVNLKDYPEAFYTKNKHKVKNLALSNPKMKADVIVGAYTSVEHCKKKFDCKTKRSNIHWTMAITGDLKGKILLPIQLLVIQESIIKDVKSFISWTGKQRLTRSKTPIIEEEQDTLTGPTMSAA